MAVLAFPTPGEMSRIKDVGEKALYYRAPYSSVPGVKQYLPREKSMPSGRVVNMDEVIDLTSLLQEDGSITWEVPSGNWTVMRFGLRNNGRRHVLRPCRVSGSNVTRLTLRPSPPTSRSLLTSCSVSWGSATPHCQAD